MVIFFILKKLKDILVTGEDAIQLTCGYIFYRVVIFFIFEKIKGILGTGGDAIR